MPRVGCGRRGLADHVIRAAAELGYTPNRVASALRLQRTGMIGLASDRIATTPFAGRIVHPTSTSRSATSRRTRTASCSAASSNRSSTRSEPEGDFSRGGTLAPTVKVDIEGDTTGIVYPYGNDGLGEWSDIPANIDVNSGGTVS